MRQKSIADFILYDLKNKKYGNHRRSDIINELVESWDNKIYLFPQENIKFGSEKHKKYTLM